jgi:hypothetical protein
MGLSVLSSGIVRLTNPHDNHVYFDPQAKMNFDRLSDDWLFQQHPKAEIKRWVQNLKYFYYTRAWGGHANDGDYFSLTFVYDDKSGMLGILDRLGITLNKTKERRRWIKWPIFGSRRDGGSKPMLENKIKDFPEYEEPADPRIAGVKCYFWINGGKIRISVFAHDGDPYEVSENDFQNCKKIEEVITLRGLANDVDRTCEASVTCISRRWYPDLFE